MDYEEVNTIGEYKLRLFFVTLSIPNPNQIINDLIDLFNSFMPDMRRFGYAYSV